MECVILFRNTHNGVVDFIGDEDGPAVFKEFDEAVACTEWQPMCRVFPYQIVELDEL